VGVSKEKVEKVRRWTETEDEGEKRRARKRK
jgi:hypothetical protein